MKLISLDSIFDIVYGNQFDLNKLDVVKDGEINFVSRSRENLGVSCTVNIFKGTVPFEKGLITVTLGGTYLLSSFIQPVQFYTSQNVKVLSPKNPMSFEEKLFYCKAIEQNRFRYSSHGREANTSLNNLLVPKSVPKSVATLNLSPYMSDYSKRISNKKILIGLDDWSYHNIVDLFDISASSDPLYSKLEQGNQTPYISSTENDNGIYNYVDLEPTNKANTITANRGGSVGYFFYQPIGYLSTPVDVRILTPKFDLNKYIAHFLTTILHLEKYRFNYSRKMGSDRLSKLKIKLPSTQEGKPDWEFMENYIKSLPYSTSI
ncbi:MAG: hypothetical protein ACI84S_000366 [Thalassomonas sp.]|jgi:hypothetical protein